MIKASAHYSRAAFTLVELLVTIAIIGVLVALLLPALQAARESARRTQCASQIKQLALALLNYEGANKQLPPSGIAEIQIDKLRNVEIVNPYGGPQVSWIVTVLPYIEQASLHRRFDLSKRIDRQPTNPQNESFSLLKCPSDDSSQARYQQIYPFLSTFAKGNYAAYTSPFHVDLQLLYPGALVSGGQPLRAVEDGMANTLALSEVRTLDRDDDWRGVWAAAWPGASLLAFDMHPLSQQSSDGEGPEYAAQINAAYTANPDSVGKTQSPNCRGPNKDTIARCPQGSSLYESAETAGMPCITSTAPPGLEGHMSAAPRSQHPNGVNGAFLDGHAEFIADQVDDFLMAYMVSVNDGSTGHSPR